MKFKSKHLFLVYYFNNIMQLEDETIDWSPKERAHSMLALIYIYKTNFKVLANYPNVQIWKSIKKSYLDNWDNLLYESMEYDEILKHLNN